MRKPPSPRVVELFARVEQTAERLVGIVAEERMLRDRLRELWREKSSVVAVLADESRLASVSASVEILRRAAKGKREVK
jgi:hypothetical protein